MFLFQDCATGSSVMKNIEYNDVWFMLEFEYQDGIMRQMKVSSVMVSGLVFEDLSGGVFYHRTRACFIMIKDLSSICNTQQNALTRTIPNWYRSVDPSYMYRSIVQYCPIICYGLLHSTRSSFNTRQWCFMPAEFTDPPVGRTNRPPGYSAHRRFVLSSAEFFKLS